MADGVIFNMPSVSQLKANGKSAYSHNRTGMIVATYLFAIAASVAGGSLLPASKFRNSFINNSPVDSSEFTGIVASAIIIAVVVALVKVVFVVAVAPPVTVGCSDYFIKNRLYSNVSLSGIFGYFSDGYGNIVKTFFFKTLIESLWSLLFIIPGIIKQYAFFCIPYIMAANPNMDCDRARELSEKMMFGVKGELFELRLSFIGWHILNFFTCGILGVVYTMPWLRATETEFFMAVYARAKAFGIVTDNDFYIEETVEHPVFNGIPPEQTFAKEEQTVVAEAEQPVADVQDIVEKMQKGMGWTSPFSNNN